MESDRGAVIDVVEAAYDIDVPPADWLPNVLAAGAPLFDLGMGCYATISCGRSPEGVPIVTQLCNSAGAEDVAMSVMAAAKEAGPAEVSSASHAVQGTVYLLSDHLERFPEAYERITRHAGCKDILSVTAVDPDTCGAHIGMPSVERLSFDRGLRDFWRMLGIHIAAGHRLRRNVGQVGDAAGVPMTEIPLDADALIDPSRFLIAHASRDARSPNAARKLRDAARMVDRARGPLRQRNPEEALRLWRGLVRGRWTLVDWFDSDGRRFVLAKSNAPSIRDPRGLSEREAQVATFAGQGETSKIIGYRLGLSPSYVSRLLRDAMRKLGVKTQAQLVERLRGIEPEGAAPATQHRSDAGS